MVYIEALTRLNHLTPPKGPQNTLLSQGFVFGTAAIVGTVDRTYIPRAGEGVRSFWLPGSRLQVVTSSQVPPPLCLGKASCKATDADFFVSSLGGRS